MNSNSRSLLLIISTILVLFIFFLIDKTYQKAQSAENMAKNAQDQMTSINTKLDSITDYFRITPKQEIINSIKINKIYPTSTITIVKEKENKVVENNIEPVKLIKPIIMEEENKKVEPVAFTDEFKEIEKKSQEAVKNKMLPLAGA